LKSSPSAYARFYPDGQKTLTVAFVRLLQKLAINETKIGDIFPHNFEISKWVYRFAVVGVCAGVARRLLPNNKIVCIHPSRAFLKPLNPSLGRLLIQLISLRLASARTPRPRGRGGRCLPSSSKLLQCQRGHHVSVPVLTHACPIYVCLLRPQRRWQRDGLARRMIAHCRDPPQTLLRLPCFRASPPTHACPCIRWSMHLFTDLMHASHTHTFSISGGIACWRVAQLFSALAKCFSYEKSHDRDRSQLYPTYMHARSLSAVSNIHACMHGIVCMLTTRPCIAVRCLTSHDKALHRCSLPHVSRQGLASLFVASRLT
jgi:hypothetical protein